MRFLTSSRATLPTRDPQQRNLALFAWTFAPLTIITVAFWCVVPHPAMNVAMPRPESDDYYLALDGSIARDERVLLHGEYDTPKYLKAADVLLLGNSRLMFGFPQDPFRKLFQRFNLSYYMLGFGHNECDLFPRELIRKFDLHPKLVIVNADYFFVGIRSRVGGIVSRESYFEARKQLFEGEVTYCVRNHLHRCLPHWLALGEERREMIVHRSRRDGAWLRTIQFP